MPAFFYRPVDRRFFLKSYSLAVMGAMAAPMLAKHKEETVRLALISDTHVAADPKNENRKFFPAENLQKILPQVSGSYPAAVIHNGDIARLTGELGDYEAVKTALRDLAQQAPIFFGMGNHDDRENFWKVFASSARERQQVKDKHVLTLELAPVRIVMLDSLMYVNKTPGLLGKTQRDWLRQHLQRTSSKPTVLFVHHTLGENDGELLDAERLIGLALEYPKVKAIVYGHSHEYSFKRRERLHLINLPAVGYNFSDKEPVGWVSSEFSGEGVSLTLHAIGGNMKDNGKTTTLSWKS
jgi:3',5'-cyclic-AMP phosphodiesterase